MCRRDDEMSLSAMKEPVKTELDVRNCGLMEYGAALAMQEKLCINRQQDKIPNTVLIVEHPAVITLGARDSENKLLVTEESLSQKGIALVKVRRGGGATAHNPGQAVLYPVVKLRTLGLGVNEFIRELEAIGIDLLERFGVKAQRRKGYPGLWVDEKKITSIGVQIKKWVTMHGMAININNDLGIFENIVPCGIEGVVITSLEKQTKQKADLQAVKDEAAKICGAHLTWKRMRK